MNSTVTTSTAENPMLRIEVEKKLQDRIYCFVDESGGVTLIDNIALPVEEQKAVYLPSQAVRALRNMLNQPDVQEFIKDPNSTDNE